MILNTDFVSTVVKSEEADERSSGDPSKEGNVTPPPPPKSAFQKVVQEQRHPPRASSPDENKPTASADATQTSSNRKTGPGMATVLQIFF